MAQKEDALFRSDLMARPHQTKYLALHWCHAHGFHQTVAELQFLVFRFKILVEPDMTQQPGACVSSYEAATAHDADKIIHRVTC